MYRNWAGKVMLAAALAALSCAGAAAQTSVAASVYGAFSGTTNGNGTAESPSNAAGGIFELRHIRNPLIGYEATYSFNRANQVYTPSGYACPASNPGCPPPAPAAVSANAHEITGDWVVSLHFANVRPFALAGLGRAAEPASERPEQHQLVQQGGLCLWSGFGLGAAAAQRAPLPVSRQSLQGTESDRALHLDGPLYAHG